jgi:hypothetical protein
VAKSKRKRRPPSNPAGASRTTRAPQASAAGRSSRDPSPAAKSTATAPLGRPAIKQPGRNRNRIVVALGIVLSLVVATVVLVYLHRLSPEERRLLRDAPAAARTAGCNQVETVPPYRGGLDRSHIGGSLSAMPPLSTYPSDPPASGPHSPATVGAGIYTTPPPIDQVIHALEHAAVVVWFAPSIGGDQELARIEAFFARNGERNHVIVAAFDYPDQGDAGSLPAGTTMALVAWHRLQLCARPSLAAAFSFVEQYRFNLWRRGSYRGVAPEKYSPI